MRARLHHLVLDCPNPRALAEFYARLDGDVYADPAGHPFCLVRRPHWAEKLS